MVAAREPSLAADEQRGTSDEWTSWDGFETLSK
jgi:hypothetical protein